jgi:CheY-like chemotaxis protein
MPGLNGAEQLANLKRSSRYTSIPKIVLSTSNAAKFIEESLGNGAIEYIVKPHSMQEMNELAKKFVALAVEMDHSTGR